VCRGTHGGKKKKRGRETWIKKGCHARKGRSEGQSGNRKKGGDPRINPSQGNVGEKPPTKRLAGNKMLTEDRKIRETVGWRICHK